MTIKERAGALFSHDAGVSVGVPKWDRDLIGLNLSPSMVLRFVAQHLSHPLCDTGLFEEELRGMLVERQQERDELAATQERAVVDC